MAFDASAAPRVLFLQGPPSDFARVLGAELMARGARVHRINLCVGDWIYWHGPGTRSYRGSLARWSGWLDGVLEAEGITDLLYFGDCQPYHRAARRVAERRGVRTLAYEYGYLRPDWIVAEPGGQSAYSRLTADPARLRAAARDLPAVDLAPCHRIDRRREARGDVIYHLANYLLALLYPRFRRDRVFNPILEYLSYLPRHRRARRGTGRRGGWLTGLWPSARRSSWRSCRCRTTIRSVPIRLTAISATTWRSWPPPSRSTRRRRPSWW